MFYTILSIMVIKSNLTHLQILHILIFILASRFAHFAIEIVSFFLVKKY